MNLVKNSLLGLAMMSTLVGVGNAQAASFTIDTFDSPGDGSDRVVTQNTGNLVDSKEIGNYPSIIGGYRDVSLVQESATNNFTDASAIALDGSIMLSNGVGYDSTLSIVWDGQDSDPDNINYFGLGGIDLTQGGELEGLLVNILSNDLNMDITFNVYTDEDEYSTATLNFAAGGSDINAFFAFDSLFSPSGDNQTAFQDAGASGADFSNVGAIEMIIGGDAGLDAQIAFVESSIEPPTGIPESNLSLISLVGVAGLGAAIRKRNLKN